jgi:hypothetical protein
MLVWVHKESIAVAYVAKDHAAEVIDLGTIGTRHADIAQLVRELQAKAKHVVFLYEVGSCWYGLRAWIDVSFTQMARQRPLAARF